MAMRGILMARLMAGAAALLLGASAAQGQVLEIGDGGAVTVHAGPAVFSGDGATAIAPVPAAALAETVAAAPAAGGVIGEIHAAAADYRIDPKLLEAVAWRESRFRQEAVSPKGATGVMQLMPGTARDLGVDRFDLKQNIRGGAAYLSRMLGRFGGNVALSLAAYNAGPGAVERFGGIPPFAETRAYVASILNRVGTAPLAAPAAPSLPTWEGLIQ
jgi:soluble lytic murein transglycosylase-like protein